MKPHFASLRTAGLAALVALANLFTPHFFSAAFAADPIPHPDEILLWPEGAPGSESRVSEPETADEKNPNNIHNVHRPTLTPYLPESEAGAAPKTAVIIAPGGGHRVLCLGHEGYALGEWLRGHGIAAFVLKYRLCNEEGSTYTLEDHAMADARRAIRLVRSRAEEWGIDPARVGIIGFSAGGELAAFSSMQSDPGNADAADPIERQGSRPDFQGLIYPGKSGMMDVHEGMPPVFIACGYHDRPDISKGMAELYLKYKEIGIPAELHIFAKAGHGFGYRGAENENDSAANRWPYRFLEWLEDSGLKEKGE